MNKLIPLLSESELTPELAAMLRPRIVRLGYLGEFFRYTAHQPPALMAFLQFTEELKHALPDKFTEIVALTVARMMGNSYEQVQHERLALKLGFGEAWLREVLALKAEPSATLPEAEAVVQQFVIAVVERDGHSCEAELQSLVEAIGSAQAIAVMMLIGRYVTHALIVNTLALAPPVPSPLGK